ncbi:MAG: hydrogen gas-evolving membrane-bound hydrogenase subunit E [Caldilineaceae bacterium]
MLLICLVSLVIASAVIWPLRPHRYPLAGWLAAIPPMFITGWLLSQIKAVAAGQPVVESYPWVAELGLELSLRLDGLALFFGLIIAGIGAAVALYTAYYLEDDPRQGYFYALLYLFMASMLGLVWADNLLLLFVFWEGTSLTSYLMVGYYYEDDEAQEGARRALLVTGISGLAMLAGLVLLGQAVGSYSISQIVSTPRAELPIYPAALVLLLIGAFAKSAQFPFHFWLPGAMAAPTPASAYLHSATMVKAGIYLLARLHPALSDTALWFWALLIVGGVTFLLGAISALRYYDLKQILAYATVSQLGALVMLLAFHSAEVYTAVVVGILAHALYKGPLFMLAGVIDHATETRDVRHFAGLGRKLPAVAVVTTLAALSMAGLPPFFGFLAKETLLETLFHHAEETGNLLEWGFVGLAALAGVYYVAYSAYLLYEAFIEGERSGFQPAEVHHAPSWGFLTAPILLTLIGTTFPFVVAQVESLIFSPPATAIAGSPVEVHLALWHGFTPIFMTSLLVIGAGIVLFLLRNQMRNLLERAPFWLNGVYQFNRLYKGSYALAEWATLYIQGGTLASQASTVLGVTVLMLVYALSKLNWAADLRIDWSRFPNWPELTVAVLAIIAAFVTVRAQTRLNAIISIGVVGVTVTLFFVFYGAPDLALTQLLIEVLTVVLLILVFHKVPPVVRPPLPQAVLVRNIVIACAMGFLGFSLVLVSAGAPYAPSIADFFKLNSAPAAHGGNIVNVILVDFRGFDTMGEITVLAIAALGGYALLRSSRLRVTLHKIRPEEQE